MTLINKSSKKISQRPPKRRVDGILLLDKGLGKSSNRVLQEVKHLWNAKKAGHTGSLDPLATGMLPICFGEATKFSQYLLDLDKAYYVKAKLGVRTTTSDAEGEIVAEKPVPALTLETLDQALESFRGEIDQIPSMYSALKYQGKPLYELARKGITVDRPSRRLKIYRIEILDYKEDILSLVIECSKGTYIRTLIDDLGELLGCGAHVIELRRTWVGHYKNQAMHLFSDLLKLDTKDKSQLDQLLLPIETALSALPTITLSASNAFYLHQGRVIVVNNLPKESGFLCLKKSDNAFLGVGEIIDKNKLIAKRLVRQT